jgi:putative monooxygenase
LKAVGGPDRPATSGGSGFKDASRALRGVTVTLRCRGQPGFEGPAGVEGNQAVSTKRPYTITASEVAPNRRRGGDLRVLLSPRNAGTTSGFLGRLTLRPGEFVSEHYHPYSEEFLYVVRGELIVRVDGEPVRLGPGAALFVPIGVRHRVENPGTEQAEAVFHLGPLAPRPELGHVDTEPLPNTASEQIDVGGRA